MKLQVPGPDGQPSWKSAAFELWSDALLRWSSSEPWPWDAGTIDVSKAKGVWLLGPPGWRRLDIILPEHRWTLAADGADGDETLQKWIKLLEGLAPEKPVSEIRNGWMEKKGAVGGGWKMRFFVLLSTHELLYFENDRSPKCKGVIDLKEASSCQVRAAAQQQAVSQALQQPRLTPSTLLSLIVPARRISGLQLRIRIRGRVAKAYVDPVPG